MTIAVLDHVRNAQPRRGGRARLTCIVCLVAWCGWTHAARGAEPSDVTNVATRESPDAQPRYPGIRRYLSRPVAPSARFVDHGVLEASVAGGWPHLYRVGLRLGVFDHVTLGVTGHWLPGEKAPAIAPDVALAFFRHRNVEIGAFYQQSLYPPPDPDEANRFQERAHWFLATLSFSQMWVSGGVDFGLVRALERHPGVRVEEPKVDPQDPTMESTVEVPTRVRHRFGGGLHLRAGTHRWGFTANVRYPYAFAEIVLDVRFGLFEHRPKGGWWPRSVVYSTDRRLPRRRR